MWKKVLKHFGISLFVIVYLYLVFFIGVNVTLYYYSGIPKWLGSVISYSYIIGVIVYLNIVALRWKIKWAVHIINNFVLFIIPILVASLLYINPWGAISFFDSEAMFDYIQGHLLFEVGTLFCGIIIYNFVLIVVFLVRKIIKANNCPPSDGK